MFSLGYLLAFAPHSQLKYIYNVFCLLLSHGIFKAQKLTHNALSSAFFVLPAPEKWIFQRLPTETLLIFEQRNVQLAGILKLQIIYPLPLSVSLLVFYVAMKASLVFVFSYFHLIVSKCFSLPVSFDLGKRWSWTLETGWKSSNSEIDFLEP